MFGKSVQLGKLLGRFDARLLSAYLPESGVPVWLLDCPGLYERSGGPYHEDDGSEWNDNAFRFAVLNAAAALIVDGCADNGWRPDVVHGQDWHAGLLPMLIAKRGFSRPATVLTIHNLAYQGLFPLDLLGPLGIEDPRAKQAFEFHGRLSFLKGGIVLADALTTVSPTYAGEILTEDYGCGLDGVLRERGSRLAGILNGVDYQVWDPKHDTHLAATYSPECLLGKRACKAALQQELGLREAADTPVVLFQSRLAHQKMPDIVLKILPDLLTQDLQFVLVADGDAGYASSFRELAAQNVGRVSVTIGYEEAKAHRMLAGADILLHPSRYEPCGLGPIYAMRYGALPVVRCTGGMADSVVDDFGRAAYFSNSTGFAFEHVTAEDLLACTRRALSLYRLPVAWRTVQTNAMRQDFGWERPARAYAHLFRSLTGEAAHDRRSIKQTAVAESGLRPPRVARRLWRRLPIQTDALPNSTPMHPPASLEDRAALSSENKGSR